MTTAVFLGDSVTEGKAGALPPYVDTTVARLGWTGVNLGASGTGYVRTFNDVGAFRSRIPDVVAAAPDVVIVAGGANDTPQGGVTLAALTAELPLFFDALAAAVPDAAVYVITPWPCKGLRLPDEIAATTAAIVTEASARGLTVIDWQPWVTGTGYNGWPVPDGRTGDGNADLYYYADNIHPSTEGAAYAGTRLAFAIRPPATGLDY